MSGPNLEHEVLLERAAAGDMQALSDLLNAQRAGLMRFVEGRLDKRLTARLDPADIVQEVLVEGACRAVQFFSIQPFPLTAWLQQLAAERIRHVHRDHIRIEKRSVLRETAHAQHRGLRPDAAPIDQLKSRDRSPSSCVALKELREQIVDLINALPQTERDVLTLRFLEQLDVEQAASQLGITRDNVRTRQLRAIRSLRAILENDKSD
jgi:RNA polymerase sigma-70 factor (ECF subfamily)